MGRGGRRPGGRKGRRKLVKKAKRVVNQSNPRPASVVAKKPPHIPPTLPSEEEGEEPTDYELLLATLRPHVKRPRIEEETNNEKTTVSEAAKVEEKKVAVKNENKSRTKESLIEASHVNGESVWDGPRAASDTDSDAGTDSESGASDVDSEAGDVSSVESEAGDVSSVESEASDNVKLSQDPFKTHFEEDLTEKEVKYLDKLFSSPLKYGQVENNPVLGSVTQATCLQNRAGVMEPVEGKTARELFIKSELASSKELSSSSDKKIDLTGLQQNMFSILSSYEDLFFTRRTFENGEEIRKAYLIHALNHVLKTRSKILKNNARLAQAAKTGKEVDGVCDQGLTRPKVLILVPFRESALRTINLMIRLLLPEGEGQVSHRKRFQEEFSEEEHLPSKTPKPKSYDQMFAGNIDDCFRVGVALRRKNVRLYSEFYSSDIIVASPLGLRTIIGADGDKKRDFDFLSSLEMVILDQCDVFLMQNWDHVLHIFSHLHLQPKDSHGADISRLRTWSINGWSRFYRQTLIFSNLFTPEINSLFNSQCYNYAGKVRVCKISHDGCVDRVAVQAPQTFHRVNCPSHRQLAEARFSYFVERILPEYSGELMKQTAIFIPSYFDFVRVRNHMKHMELSYALLSEYTKTSDVSRSRTWFFHKERHFLLFTERLHFFRRYHVRGIRHILFYSLPLYNEFYPEIVNMLEGAGQMGGVTCTVLYSCYELHLLSRVVGSNRAQQMLLSDDHIHMLVTET